MNITVVGTGYVGLVTGTCFAEMGNNVTCVDIDSKKVESLKRGVIPIYEPKLDQLVLTNTQAGRLHFTTSLSEAMSNSNIYFIAVGTPPGEDGSADLKYVLEVARAIGRNIDRYAIVVNKSTVPVGTADHVRSAVQAELDLRKSDIQFDVVSNPEFLKEGDAVDDFMQPDRVVIGVSSDRSKDLMTELYAPFNRNHKRLMFMGVRDAEMTKYAANAMLATKISFMNEIASLCEHLDVDVESVRLGIGSDQRIGYHFIYPGAGYGGSCFPKDVKALVHMAEKIKFEPKLLQAVEERNDLQKHRLFEKILARYDGSIEGMTFGIWGLAFKPGTDDMREAPSTVLIKSLLDAGAKVKAYDPVAKNTAILEYPADVFEQGMVVFTDEQYEALDGSDALVLVTEWKAFRNPDFSKIRSLLKAPMIFDGRNQYDLNQLTREGFTYIGIGRKTRGE